MLRLIAAALIAWGAATAGWRPLPASAAPPPLPLPQTMQPAHPDAPRLPERLDEGPRIALPARVFHQDRPSADPRPAYLGAGLVVLALVFWWNRRRRDRFEREDGDRPVAAQPRRRGDADRDADDLHAAARGDGADPSDPPDPPAPPSPDR